MTNPTTDEMAREVYEAITGKKVGHLNLDDTYVICPPLATSLDAWHEHIFRKMDLLQVSHHGRALQELTGFQANRLWLCTPMHHLTAAYKVLKGEL